eukprot:CAMPEP_0170491308 /NCGR_PEP_ID=MMETSP0208-20121228/10763_1 /TAXON_ID=197538 /ORGANISM="Strombidium inclinatum, Strain S3" /LENGTH=217 /DNA_ID=CAMNT_0010766861 /DNA_START=103 /DNA_END=757 /DNA_ORIENTATION=-
MRSEEASSLGSNSRLDGLVLHLLHASFGREGVAEVEHDSVELEDAEKKAQHIALMHQREPEGEEHASEEYHGLDDVLLFTNLDHVLLGAVPEEEAGEGSDHGEGEDASEGAGGGHNGEDVNQADEQEQDANSKGSECFRKLFSEGSSEKILPRIPVGACWTGALSLWKIDPIPPRLLDDSTSVVAVSLLLFPLLRGFHELNLLDLEGFSLAVSCFLV